MKLQERIDLSQPYRIPGERVNFSPNDLIVSKTDPKGIIRYANDVFCNISGYSIRQLVGAPHSILRHPLMPAAIFELLWSRIKNGQETFAYVLNRTRTGNYYWVFAHVTPTRDLEGRVTGYHSNRRVPADSAVEKISTVYSQLLELEKNASSKKEGIQKGLQYFDDFLQNGGMNYEEYIFSFPSI